MWDVITNKKVILIVLVVAILGFLYYQNNSIMVSKLKLNSDKLPKEFNGYRIVHLSDLHNKTFGQNQKILTSKIKKLQPDIIVITGDIVDSRRFNSKSVLILLDNIKEIAPVYYVTGNHDFRIREYQDFESEMEMRGVNILRNRKEVIELDKAFIHIVGIDDPLGSRFSLDEGEIIRRNIEVATEGQNEDYFTILLSHRPEFFSIYKELGIDLTLAGHAHGGQIRLPIIGGMVAPNQGLFPKFTAGKYVDGNSVMVVSRGLGNSIIPQRIFNRPEIVVVELLNGITN